MADAYDLLPYTEYAYAESSPDNLAVIAALSGFTPSPGADGRPFGGTLAPRVLELGCGRGGNLLPLASAWPDATFVGVDRSAAQLRDARRVAEAAALGNVSFVTGDFVEASVPVGSFDFVLCHGVYSWVPVAARQALLGGIRNALCPGGIAYVSFNTLPGWYRRLAARDWMRFAAREALGDGPREALEWLSRSVSPEHAAYRSDLAAVRERLVATDAAYLTHEYLAEEHHPVYVSTFLEEAALAGLSYLGDALPQESALELLPGPVQKRVRLLDPARALALSDFARDTAFRRALLVRTDTAESLGFQAPHRLNAGAIARLRVASRLSSSGDQGTSDIESFTGGATRVQVSGLERRALHALAAAAPRSIACADLASAIGVDEGALAAELFELWIASPGIDLHLREPDFTTAVSGAPCAGAVARWHAIEGGPVTNAWHQEVLLPEPVMRFVLGRLDGKTTTEELVQAVTERASGAVSVARADAVAVVRASLDELAKAALLVG